MTNVHSREPAPAVVQAMLMAEIERDAPKLADLMFGSNSFPDDKKMTKPQYLEHLRWCYVNGATIEGHWVSPEAWCLRQIQRVGEHRFVREMAEAWDVPYREPTPNDMLLISQAVVAGGVVEDWGADALAQQMALDHTAAMMAPPEGGPS